MHEKGSFFFVKNALNETPRKSTFLSNDSRRFSIYSHSLKMNQKEVEKEIERDMCFAFRLQEQKDRKEITKDRKLVLKLVEKRNERWIF